MPTHLPTHVRTPFHEPPASLATFVAGLDDSGVARPTNVIAVRQNPRAVSIPVPFQIPVPIQVANGSDGLLLDESAGTGRYSASVCGAGVRLRCEEDGRVATGVFINGTPPVAFEDAGWANGGALAGFRFTLYNSKLEAGQTAAGTFVFPGSLRQARRAIRAAGFRYWLFGSSLGSDEYRSPGEPRTGRNSGHFIVSRQPGMNGEGAPRVTGSMHFGERNPLRAPLTHFLESRR